MQNKPSKWVSGYKHGPAASYTQITRMGLFLNVATSKFEPLDSTWDNLHSGGMFISDDNKIYFRDETNKDIYINSNADNEITIAATSGVTISGGNLIIGTAGKGIDFSAQTSTTATGAAATAELLDHYEEGTWTAALSDGTDDATMGQSSGYYTRIGNLVHISAYVVTSALGDVNGAVRITGLPFSVANSYAAFSSTGATYAHGLNITAGQTVGTMAYYNQSYLKVKLWDLTSGVSDLLATEWSDDGGIVVGGSYRT
jgi:hypothetical protein